MHARQCIIPETCLPCIVSQANREKQPSFVREGPLHVSSRPAALCFESDQGAAKR